MSKFDSTALDDLEARVTEKFARRAAERPPLWDVPDISLNLNDWANLPPLPPGTPVYPRERWVTSPSRRLVTLVTIDHALDFEDVTDEQWALIAHLMTYGGRERIA